MTDTDLTLRLIRELVGIMDGDYSSESECEKAMEDKIAEIERDHPEALVDIAAAVGIAAVIGKRYSKASNLHLTKEKTND